MTDITSYILYSTDGCHLCEQAYELCFPLLKGQMAIVDIVDDNTLVEQYGMSIPVLKNRLTEQELCWPFSVEQVKAFIRA